MAGVKTRLMSATRGMAVMTTTFAGYKPWAGDFDKRDRGNLLSHESGTVTGHGLKNAQERGTLFAAPGDDVYENQASQPAEGDGQGGALRPYQGGGVRASRARFGSPTQPPLRARLVLRQRATQSVDGTQRRRPPAPHRHPARVPPHCIML